MAGPTMLDVRDGLTHEAIASLQRACRVQLAIASPLTLVLGLWDQQDGSDLRTALVLREYTPTGTGSTEPPGTVLLDQPCESVRWKNMIAGLRRSERLEVHIGDPERIQFFAWMRGLPSRPHSGGARVTTVRRQRGLSPLS